MLVIFDLMETLLTDPYREAHEAAVGMSFEEFERLRPPGVYYSLERGEIKEAAYWDSLRQAGIACDPDLFHKVRRSGYRWLDGMRKIVAECARARRTVIGSNYPDWIDNLARTYLADMRIDVFASCHFGVRKPAAGFFEAICDRCSVTPEELVLIDDKKENTDSVIRMGGQGVRFISAKDACRQLQNIGILP